MNSTVPNQELKIFKSRNIYIGIVVGLFSTLILFNYNTKESLSQVVAHLSDPRWLWLAGAVLALVIRDLFYVFRIKKLTSDELTWKGSIYTIILWEFASSVTPSVVGGTAIAMFILNKEGLTIGKSIAIVMLTAILDNLFFIIASPIIMYNTSQEFLSVERLFFGVSFKLNSLFLISYVLISAYTAFMVFGVLIRPKAFKRAITRFASMFNYKWKRKMIKLSVDVMIASRELKGMGLMYWVKGAGFTLIVWVSRYFIVNCILAAYSLVEMSASQHLDVFSKHVILWVTQLISPTPGGSGLSEYFFMTIIGTSIGIATLWRGLTYYAYLILGSMTLPKWLKRVMMK